MTVTSEGRLGGWGWGGVVAPIVAVVAAVLVEVWCSVGVGVGGEGR